MITVTLFGEPKKPLLRISIRALWREMFGAPDGTTQLPLFAAADDETDDLELMEDGD